MSYERETISMSCRWRKLQ